MAAQPAPASAHGHQQPVISLVDHLVQFFMLFVGLTLEIVKAIVVAVRSLFSQGKPLDSDVVLITGGAGGLGKRLARRFLEKGSRVVLVDISATALEKVVKELTALKMGKVIGLTCDVTDRVAVYDLARKVNQEFNAPVSILVNNAGIVSGKTFLENSEEAIIKTFNVNTLSNYWTVRAFLPEMVRQNKGHVVTIASAAGLCGSVGLSDYAASKWAQVGFTESLRLEMKHISSSVKTTCVCPYIIDTGMFDGVTTKFPAFLPILNPDYVADKVIYAVQHNQEMLILPDFPKITVLCRALLPVSAFDFLVDFFSINQAMAGFKGKKL